MKIAAALSIMVLALEVTLHVKIASRIHHECTLNSNAQK